MKDKIAKYISEFGNLSDAEIEIFRNNINPKQFKKGTFLLKEGEFSDNCYFVLKGCVRQFYFDKNGEEKTTEFYTENQAITPLKNNSDKIPSKFNLECLEDSFLTVSNPSIENEMYKKFSGLESITRKIIEKDFGNLQDDYATFISSSPEQRYLNLLSNRPYLFQRVPNYQIASYLGMTPESLSRIKRRVLKKKIGV